VVRETHDEDGAFVSDAVMSTAFQDRLNELEAQEGFASPRGTCIEKGVTNIYCSRVRTLLKFTA
jgi:hypothetical protein